jgi:hypothetical protein
MDRYNWIVYPETKQKLKDIGIAARIERANDEYKFTHMGHLFDREVVGYVSSLSKEGLLNAIPEEERKHFKKTIQEKFANRDKEFWLIKRNDQTQKEKMELEDFILLSGYRASELLRKNELFNYKKFGFSSIFEFTGTVGAAIESTFDDINDLRKGHTWETLRADGRTIASTITGDHNADLRIFQRDITAYETTDPMGNKIGYRPETNSDHMIVGAYHSTETQLLVAVLRYVNQIGIKPESLENNAVQTLNWAKSLGQGGGSCAEHYGGFDRPSSLFFAAHEIPLPQLNGEYKTKDRSVYSISTQFEGGYDMCIGPNKEFRIVYGSKELGNAKQSVSFIPEDMDNVIKGIIYQAAKGLGRTSVRQLIDVLEYRFSPQFAKEYPQMVG